METVTLIVWALTVGGCRRRGRCPVDRGFRPVGVAVAGCTAGLLSTLNLSRYLAAAIENLGDLVQRIGEAPGTATAPVDPGSAAIPGGPREVVLLAVGLQEALGRLAKTRGEAATTERRRRQLVAGVSHDLRTPLAGIRVMVEALEDGVVQDEETVARYLPHHRP